MANTVLKREKGAVTVELVLAMPLFLLSVLMIIQFVLWRHAKQAVELAAEEALDAAQIEGAVGEGEAEAATILSQTGQVTNQKVVVTVTGEVVTVTISGKPRYSVLPIKDTVTATAAGRVERFIGEQER